MNEPTAYFWIATLTWRDGVGTRTWSRSGGFTSDEPVSRADALAQVVELAEAPKNVIVQFFSIERDEVR